MTAQFDAVYENGVLRPKQPLMLPNGTEVRVAIQTRGPTDDPLAGVIGIAEVPDAGNAADKHNDYIYGEPET
ncbi:MAG TPA: antitoxin family protein [Lacipirellulaceae bacterium]|nr:antitoxin family protein [Lacipirellulaceae bacterium]